MREFDRCRSISPLRVDGSGFFLGNVATQRDALSCEEKGSRAALSLAYMAKASCVATRPFFCGGKEEGGTVVPHSWSAECSADGRVD